MIMYIWLSKYLKTVLPHFLFFFWGTSHGAPKSLGCSRLASRVKRPQTPLIKTRRVNHQDFQTTSLVHYTGTYMVTYMYIW